MSALRRVAVRVAPDELEPALARILELAPGGIEQQDVDGLVELAAYVDVGDVAALVTALRGAVVTPVAEGWEDAWRSFHRPATVAGLWIGPPWLDRPSDAPTVVIDPGRAFGTGAHPTTRLCVALLDHVERGSLLDVGCGSGVLAIAGVRLGFGPVRAVDLDPVAVRTTLENAEVNGVDLEVGLLDATEEGLPPADVVVANVLLEPVERILGRLACTTAITSGYLAGEQPAHEGWAPVERLELDGWAGDVFRRARAT